MRWVSYAAAAWAFAFAAVSVYWALGGEAGLETIADDVGSVPLASNPVVVWGTALLKTGAGVLALATVQLWGRCLPQRLLSIALWCAGTLFTLYGAANLIDHGRMVSGVRDTPETLGDVAARWHLLLWDPWWLLGGVLFLLAAWQFRR